ncbi:phenylacetate--CoA ligase family protein [Magnetospirillum sp. UT-4]|uniref:phenylacetate--CoA ligase family protein n=1 Tax=Magnetospirillum sp. UT-4 TaxID=2681467 RepID=UPI001384B624|nr:AMP-binding protein [Magnetospirillum sp. UT-4]CAA7621684.1 Phenylacetate-CoA ligase [Magnetospirillum sp. UT-4]
MRLTKPEEESELLAALTRAQAKSPFWRDRFAALGLRPGDFVPGFPFEQLPLLSKSELLADQAEHGPLGRLLAVPPEEIRRIHKTSGTSARPLFIALTQRDIADTYVSATRAFKAAGMGPGDRVAHCLNFNMWSGGVSDYLPIEAVGATGIPFGVGNTSLLLETIRSLGVNAISSTPSYMYTLRDRCRAELGLDPAELGLKRGYFGGEGLLQVPGVRAGIERDFGLVAIDANYGMSEVLSIIAGEDAARDGLVYHAWGIVYAELVDPSGRPLPIEAGATGELVFSSLRREGQPLFRYRTNDLAEILWAETADDGLLRMRYRIIGRSDEMLVLRGVNFFPQALQSVIPAFEPALSRFYRVVRPKDGDCGALEVLFETDLPDGAERDHLAASIAAKVAATFQVRIEVHWLPMGRIPREANKARYLVRSADEI